MSKRQSDKIHMLEVHAAQRFHELLRQDHARDAQSRKDQAKERARANRKAAWIDGLLRTAEARIAGCKEVPTPLAVREMRRIADDITKPARARAEAAAGIFRWAR
ncbi:hypothetical protein [Methylobacterium sp. Leaf99]|uniref:hypothetical protein n=1 Tax=Methylobacterium sp. Leaf99 TaxID=1736251 RepID=UPI000A68FE60|nr:hypothetical protein [Methylobacterium sp. Leaf99]